FTLGPMAWPVRTGPASAAALEDLHRVAPAESGEPRVRRAREVRSGPHRRGPDAAELPEQGPSVVPHHPEPLPSDLVEIGPGPSDPDPAPERGAPLLHGLGAEPVVALRPGRVPH